MREVTCKIQVITGCVDIKVREPEPWVPGVPTHAGLVVNLDPYNANLDEFWANKIDLSINGPDSHSVTFTLSLETSSGKRILSKQIGPAFNLPVSKVTWHKQFLKFLKRHEEAGWDYLEASSGTLAIQADELGHYHLRFDRDVIPVRWITRRRQGQIVLRLIDDTGLENDATCYLFSMDHPTKAESLEVSKLLSGISPKPPGGLFSARNGDHRDDIIVSNIADSDGFQGLGVKPLLTDIENGSTPIASALHTLSSWNNARLAGAVAEYKRGKVVSQIHHAVYAKLCGQNWAKAEAAFMNNPNSAHVEQELQRRVGKNNKFSDVLKRDYSRFSERPNRSIQWYAALAHRYNVSSNSALCAFAVHLAFEPYTLSASYGDQLDSLVHQAISYTELLRGARYAALLLSEQGQGDENSTAEKRRGRWH